MLLILWMMSFMLESLERVTTNRLLPPSLPGVCSFDVLGPMVRRDSIELAIMSPLI